MQNFVLFDHVCKTYRMGDVRIDALKDASFTIAEGEICVIVRAVRRGQDDAFKHSRRHGPADERPCAAGGRGCVGV